VDIAIYVDGKLVRGSDVGDGEVFFSSDRGDTLGRAFLPAPRDASGPLDRLAAHRNPPGTPARAARFATPGVTCSLRP
jgi:hypothetical protein